MRLGILHAESVPLWASHWLVQGHGGEAVAELAGLSGRDTRAVRDLLPAALEEMGEPQMSSTQAEAKVAFDHIASLHLDGRVSWRWVVDKVLETMSQNNYADEFFEQPLGYAFGLADEIHGSWGRSLEDVALAVRAVCAEQVGMGQPE
jgi:hypothetical protein